MSEDLKVMDQIRVNLGRRGRDMIVVFPSGMSRNERRKAVSELFSLIRTIKEMG